MIEFALVVMLLLTLLLGIIDFSLMLKNYLALSQVAREGARSAALGSPSETVQARIDTWASDLGLKNGSLGTSVNEEVLSPEGSEVTVTLTYTYPLVTGNFLPLVAGMRNPITLQTSMVMRKE